MIQKRPDAEVEQHISEFFFAKIRFQLIEKILSQDVKVFLLIGMMIYVTVKELFFG